jgi:hypothetical protein
MNPLQILNNFQVQTNLFCTFLVQDEACPSSSSRHCAFIFFDEKSLATMFNKTCDDKLRKMFKRIRNYMMDQGSLKCLDNVLTT